MSGASILTTTNIGNVPFGYDALDHIGQVEFQPMPFVVKAGSKWKTFKDFAADCKAKPKSLKIAFAGIGSATHLAAIALTQAAGCKAIMLPVKAPQRNAKVLSGEVDGAMHIFINPLKLVRAGKLKFLAITSSERNPATPNVPTAKELGYDVTLDLFRGLSVPKGTPTAAKAKLEDAMIKAAKALVQIQYDDVTEDPEEVTDEFRDRYYDTELFFDPYAGGKFAHYLFAAHDKVGTPFTPESAHHTIEESQLFIEAVHSCYNRMRTEPVA